MKTAVIIIPSLNKDIFPLGYLSICANKVSSMGYTLLHSQDYNEYKSIELRDFIDRINPVINAFFFFVDFGVNDLMTELILKGDKEINIEITEDPSRINLEGLLFVVSKKSDIPIEALKRKTRKREIVESRQIYFKAAKQMTKSSLSAIGRLVRLDHSTVIHGIKVVNNVKELSERYYEYFGGPKPQSLIRKEQKSLITLIAKPEPIPEPVAEIKPEKTIDKEPVYISPFENIPAELHEYKSYCEI